VLLDPTDPYPEGYLLSDTWPGPDMQVATES
jgi:proline racemase